MSSVCFRGCSALPAGNQAGRLIIYPTPVSTAKIPFGVPCAFVVKLFGHGDTKIEAAYQTNQNSLVRVPIRVGDITTYLQATPGFHGRDAVTEQEADHLTAIGEWEAGTAELLNQLAADARAQQAARDKFNSAVANHPALVWVPIDVGGITTFIQVTPEDLTPEMVLTADELALYNAPDYLSVDGVALAEFYATQVEAQQARQRQVETYRSDYARTASRLSQNSVAYTTMISLLNGGTGQITFWQATGRDAAGRLTSQPLRQRPGDPQGLR